MHITIGLFGNQELCMEMARKLGKKGTENDIAIFNHASSEGIFTYVCVNSEKIAPLIQALNMADAPVLMVSELTKEVGEVIVALDEIGFDRGFIVASESCRSQIENIIKNTTLKNYVFADENNLRLELIKLQPAPAGSEPLVLIDNYFNVKSVGTVILGLVKSGSVKKYDKLMVEPLGKEVLIKGIQSQDRDFESTEIGMRVGLSLKGIEADELRRGYIICKNMKKSNKLTLKLKKSKFFRQEVRAGLQIMLCVGLQAITCSVESIENDIIKLSAISPVAYTENQKFILAFQGEALPRIIGSGIIENE